MVPASSTTSWSIPIDTITYLANGTSQGVAGALASIDMYRSYTIPLSCSEYSLLVAELAVYFADTGIQVTNEVASQIYAGTPGAQAISDTEWSIPCGSTFPISLTFGGKLFMITERDSILQPTPGVCTGIVTGGATQAIGKVGAPFLRNVYTFVPIFPIIQTLGGILCFLFLLSDNSLRPNLRMGQFSSVSGSRRKTCARLLPQPQPQSEPFRKQLSGQLFGHRQPPRVRRITVVHKICLATLYQHLGWSSFQLLR